MCHSPYILIGGVGVTKRFFVLFLFFGLMDRNLFRAPLSILENKVNSLIKDS